LKISPIPGACAAIAALSAAGIASDRFCFEGFLPAKAAARRERLQQLAREPRTLVFYESAHRIEEALCDLVAVFGGEREAVLARELTKLFETLLGDSLAAIAQRVAADENQRKGEFVLVVRGAADDGSAALREGRRLYEKLGRYLPPSQAAKLAAELSGAPRKALYGGEGAEAGD
jgi:16S rRNA (cytidine1402-2'-O)-methyltransferase